MNYPVSETFAREGRHTKEIKSAVFQPFHPCTLSRKDRLVLR